MKLLLISVPFFSSFSISFLGRFIGYKGGRFIGILTMLISLLISINLLISNIEGYIYILNIKSWFEVGLLRSNFELIFDKESILMLNLISFITLIVISYSCWYLSGDAHLNRFLSKLLIFSVSMYILVSAKNFLFLFFGWEGVGIVSYLLINFWFLSPSNNKSAIKALIFNKIGDIFFLLSLLLISLISFNFDIQNINFYNLSIDTGALEDSGYSNLFFFILLFFILAAIAKSAQIFLHCWLGDAMAGPTPVSALLHAATMVTAGIFLLLRCNNFFFLTSLFFENRLRLFILIIGSLTIIFAGLSSLNQFDLKKIIAYSTCAQVGFMFFALSLIKPLYGSLFHLITHGFFKALLFLSAGLIIHSFLSPMGLGGFEQDLRKYGSFIFASPISYFFFLIGTLAIIGFPPLSGFFSKDLILLHSFSLNSLFPWYTSPLGSGVFFPFFLLFGSLLSSFYSFKILFFSFLKNPPSILYSSSSPSPFSYFFFPLFFLIAGSIFLGFFSSSFFASPENLNLDLEFFIPIFNFNLKYIPFLLPFFALIVLFFFFPFFKETFSNPIFNFLFSIFNRRFFFDTFYNYFFLYPTLLFSYHITYKFLDRGFLEFIGPLGFFRLFFFFASSFNLSSQSSSNLPYLFFYFFFSFFFFSFCLFFI